MPKTFQACAAVLISLCVCSAAAVAQDSDREVERDRDRDRDQPTAREACAGLPTFDQLRSALIKANNEKGGLQLQAGGNNMWATVVNRDGVVCAVASTGRQRGDQWPGSRAISAQKANTANAFSLPEFALSTANLYAAVQPGGSLFGIQESNPVSTTVAYRGDPANYGTANDPMIGRRIGGINVFGGGLALYQATNPSSRDNTLIGAIGVSGDTSCRDHRVAWQARFGLGLDAVPQGVSRDKVGPDNIIYDIPLGNLSAPPTEGARFLSPGGFGHPQCDGTEATLAANLSPTSGSRKVATAR